MKTSIVFRATFEQPIGPLNPSGWKMPGPVWIEIYCSKVGPPAEWKARKPGTRADFDKITPQSTPATLKRQIEGVYFQKQLTPWEASDTTHGGSVPRLLMASDWATDPKSGVPYLTEFYREKLKAEEIRKVNEASVARAETYERDFKPQ
jgi:hypothetical protein